jgi:hypothetical protein
LHRNVKELVWKPPGLEALGSENGSLHTTCDLHHQVCHVTPVRNKGAGVLDKGIFYEEAKPYKVPRLRGRLDKITSRFWFIHTN